MAKFHKDDPTRDWVNPFRLRVRDFPNRIYCFEDFESDRASVSARMQQADGVFVEIGSGSGIHLIGQGRRLPNSIFFGFELRFKRAVRTIEKAEKYDVANVCVLNYDASEIARIFPPSSIDGLYVNFPDPWAKPKQLKHRLFSRPFLDTASKLLRPGGFLSFKTDHAEYFSSVIELFEQDCRFYVECVDHDLHRGGDSLSESAECRTKHSQENVLTEFEEMFLNKSLPVGYLSVRLRKN